MVNNTATTNKAGLKYGNQKNRTPKVNIPHIFQFQKKFQCSNPINTQHKALFISPVFQFTRCRNTLHELEEKIKNEHIHQIASY